MINNSKLIQLRMIQKPIFKCIINYFHKLDFQKISNQFIIDFNGEMVENPTLLPKNYRASIAYHQMQQKITNDLKKLILIGENSIQAYAIDEDQWKDWFRVITDMDNIFQNINNKAEFITWLHTKTNNDFKIRFKYGEWNNKGINNPKLLNTSFCFPLIPPTATYDPLLFVEYNSGYFSFSEVETGIEALTWQAEVNDHQENEKVMSACSSGYGSFPTASSIEQYCQNDMLAAIDNTKFHNLF